jgi:hypothetical protein
MPLHHMGFSGTGQPAGANQAAVTTTVGAAVTAGVGAAVATTAATSTTPFGFSEAQANDLVTRVNSLRVDVLALTTLANAARADVLALATLANQVRTDLISLSLIKGGA